MKLVLAIRSHGQFFRHTVVLLPNNGLLAVFRTEAGDGDGRYGPYYSTRSTDAGLSWSSAVPLKDTDGNYIGCARPHMVTLDGGITLLAGAKLRRAWCSGCQASGFSAR